MEQENNLLGKKKKHGEGKGGCIYNINNWRSKIFFLWKRRNTEKKKEENIWRRNISFFAEEKENGEGRGGKYLDMDFFLEERKNCKGK